MTIEALITHFQEQGMISKEPWKRGSYRRACELLQRSYEPSLTHGCSTHESKARDTHNLAVQVVEYMTMLRLISVWESRGENYDEDRDFFLADLQIQLATLRAFCHKYPEMLPVRQEVRVLWEKEYKVSTQGESECFSPREMRAKHTAIRMDRTMRQ